MEQKGPRGGGAGYARVRPFGLETEVKNRYAGRRGRDCATGHPRACAGQPPSV